MRDDGELDSREQEVLATIIRQYVVMGIPVASKTVAAQFPEPLSPATIRNIMADLEAAGYLTQPHTSAGRIPADKAYRFYVDRISRPARLTLRGFQPSGRGLRTLPGGEAAGAYQIRAFARPSGAGGNRFQTRPD